MVSKFHNVPNIIADVTQIKVIPVVPDFCIKGTNIHFQNKRIKPIVIPDANIILIKFFINLLLTKSINLFNTRLKIKNTVINIIIPKITARIINPKK